MTSRILSDKAKSTHSSKLKVRFGVSIRLLLAFASTACFAMLSAWLTTRELTYTSDQLSRVRDQDIPSLVEALDIVKNATSIVSTLPTLRAADNSTQLDSTFSHVDNQISHMIEHEEHDDHLRAVTNLGTLIKRFAELKSAALLATSERQNLTHTMQLAHSELTKQLEPLIDDLQFDIIITSENIATHQYPLTAIKNIVDNDMTALTELVELKAEVNLIISLLTQAAVARDKAEIVPLKERFLAAEGKINRILTVILDFYTNNIKQRVYVANIKKRIKAFLQLGKGERSIFALHAQELRSNTQLTELATELTSNVETFTKKFNNQSIDTSDDIANRFNELQQGFKKTEKNLMILASLSFLFGISVLVLYVWLGLAKRLTLLSRAMQSIAAGHYDIEPKTTGSDEITVMAHTVKELRDTARNAQQFRSKLANRFDLSLRQVIEQVSQGSDKVGHSTHTLNEITQEVSKRNDAVSDITDTNITNIKSVSTATHRLSKSIDEINQQLQDASNTTRRSVQAANQTAQTMQKLVNASDEIDSVRQLISDIAEQTNLLALNATIEASHAGVQGRGFAVVAREVKRLAVQTAAATGDIANRIQEVQSVTKEATSAINIVVSSIEEVEQSAHAIATSLGEQSEATASIVHSVNELEDNGVKIRKNVKQVSQSVTGTSHSLCTLTTLADSLMVHSDTLAITAQEFVGSLRQEPGATQNQTPPIARNKSPHALRIKSCQAEQ